MAQLTRRKKPARPRSASTRKLTAETEAALKDVVLDYFANGPRLGPPILQDGMNLDRRVATEVRGPWDLAGWEDRGEVELIEAAEEADRQGLLADFAGRVAILRQMEEDARSDDTTLLELIKFDMRVPRGGVPVRVGDVVLEPIVGDAPFQFPTLWSTRGRPRYVDVLMRDGAVPYVVELKVGTASVGQYYRHAITRAALYREFIRGRGCSTLGARNEGSTPSSAGPWSRSRSTPVAPRPSSTSSAY